MTGDIERREFFRIRDRLLIEYRAISNEESLRFEKSLQQTDLYGTTDPSNVRLARTTASTGSKDDLKMCLGSIDRQLNTIIYLLTRKTEPFQSRYLDVNISGAGISFVSEMKITEGTDLELRIVLPYFPNPCITALGRVVHSRRCDDCEEESWETGLSFAAIREQDRELLINYVFAKERECLRAKQNQNQ
jgi:c-di-GMP-binding flagellar brake protein YcgR